MQEFFKRITIKGALAGTLGVFAVLLVMMAVIGYVAGDIGQRSVEEIKRVPVTQVDQITWANVQRLTARVKLAIYHDAVLDKRVSSSADKTAKDDEIRQHLNNARDYLAQFGNVPEGASEKAQVQAVLEKINPLLDLIDRQLKALEANDLAQYDSLDEQQMTMLAAFDTALKAYYEHSDNATAELMHDYSSKRRLFTTISMLMLGLAALVMLAVRLGLQRVVVQPLSQAVAHLQRLAKADLSQSVNVTTRNEVGQLLAAMRDMQDSLSSIVASVRDGSGSILVGAQQIATGNADLSSRTEQQAAALEETAASMEQLTATVKQNADNARQASTLANDASHTAGEGREVVGRVVQTMQEITDSSQQIASIIGVIDSIAFQTNILALNASVEAARAGEQGRGFAVVAGEVRSLASRSADAAREIKALIEDSSRRVKEGSQLVDQAGKTIGDVVSAVRRVTDIIDEISAASQEQSSGIAQVNTAIAQMDEVTQQNAALVQESAAASASLADQAHNLEQAVVVFRLAGEQGRVARPAPRAEAAAPLKRPQLSGEPARKPNAAAEEQWESF